MSSVVVTGIGELTTHDPELGTLHDAAVVAEEETITWVGPAARAPAADRRIDVGGRAVVPGFVDSHTHLVFAGDRAAEFAARMRGERYDGGGIASTVAATRAADDAALRALLGTRIAELRAQGTTTVEIKSGYGLTVADEERALRLAAEVTAETTFLGAHVVPAGAARDEYLALVTGPMLAACAPHARWVDVFCEPAQPARVRRRRGPRRARGRPRGGPGPAGARQPARRRPGGGAGRRAGRRERRPLHLPDRRGRRRARRAATPSPPCCRASSSPPARPTRTRGGCSTPACRSRWRPTATRAPARRRRCR